MLISLHIKNLALADEVTVNFGDGMNVLTGETGAGKSIVVDALNLAVGGRAEREMIRQGAEFARVDAVFDIGFNRRVLEIMSEIGQRAEGGMLIVSRELNASGRSSCRLNGVPVTLSLLRSVTCEIVDIHGQHEHQTLMDETQHVRYLDGFGGDQLSRLLSDMDSAYDAFKTSSTRLSQLSIGEQEAQRRLDALTFQLKEITAAKIKPGEDQTLEKQRLMLRNAERITQALSQSYSGIYAGGEGVPSAQAQLKDAMDAFMAIAELDDVFKGIYARLSEAYYAVQDIGYDIRDAKDSDRFDPQLAEKVEARLDKLQRLKRKYGATLEDIARYSEQIESELNRFSHREEDIAHMTHLCTVAKARMLDYARTLSASRSQLAEVFSQGMCKQLSELGMENARFDATVSYDENACRASGGDTVRFLFSANQGEPPRSLSKVASGGEISRVMLAIKTLGVDSGDAKCMVFDEIDAGISGYTAQVVGEKMAQLARHKQVICVTHLAQISCCASRHLFVEKHTEGTRVVTNVHVLDGEDRVKEIARMAGGSITETALSHAREMLKKSVQ